MYAGPSRCWICRILRRHQGEGPSRDFPWEAATRPVGMQPAPARTIPSLNEASGGVGVGSRQLGAWARSPVDAYWLYRDTFFDEFVPAPGRLTLELGCGEGRVVRDLIARGHRVVALDGSLTLLRYAHAESPMPLFQADAAALPLLDGAVDLAVAYNTLQDFDEMPAAISEAGRVLALGAALCICVVHPVFDIGRFEGEEPAAQLRLRDRYLEPQPVDIVEERSDLDKMRFTGWSYPLEAYFAALTSAGFVVDSLREPVPTSRDGRWERWHRYPLFLFMRARKLRL
jgi:SAM-dependent methyltransferase